MTTDKYDTIIKQRTELSKANQRTIEAYRELEKLRKKIAELEAKLTESEAKAKRWIEMSAKLMSEKIQEAYQNK